MHCRLHWKMPGKQPRESSVGQFAKCLRDYRKRELGCSSGRVQQPGEGSARCTIDWYSSWPLLRLRLLFTKVITWPRLCCDPITAVFLLDACVHHFSHHVPHATGKLRHFATCVAASSISTIVASSGPSQALLPPPPPLSSRPSLSPNFLAVATHGVCSSSQREV